MKYYYFPSTFFHNGVKGGSLRACGCMVARNLKGGFTSLKNVEPVALSKVLPDNERALLQNVESNKQPVEIGNKRWNLWKTLKTVASGTNSLVGFTANALSIAQAIKNYRKPQPSTWDKMSPSAIAVAKFVGPIIIEQLIRSALSGAGLRKRRSRLIKGSPEAKAYMARLRAMRGHKRRAYY